MNEETVSIPKGLALDVMVLLSNLQSDPVARKRLDHSLHAAGFDGHVEHVVEAFGPYCDPVAPTAGQSLSPGERRKAAEMAAAARAIINADETLSMGTAESLVPIRDFLLAVAEPGCSPPDLAMSVFNAVSENVESVEEDLGADLAYLMAAILNGTFCEWPAGRPILRVLKEKLGEGHQVWRHIKIEEG